MIKDGRRLSFLLCGLSLLTVAHGEQGNYYPGHIAWTATGAHNAASAWRADLFVPVWQNIDNVAFADLRATDFSGSPFEGNAGLGFRHLNSANSMLFGGYTFIDRRRTVDKNYFNQLTFGGEWETQLWYTNMNVYLPLGKSDIADGTFVNLVADGAYENISYGTHKLTAMGGVDARVGYRFSSQLTGYFGGYYFAHGDAKTIAGPMTTWSYDWFAVKKPWARVVQKVSLEGSYRYDNQRHNQWFIGFTIQFGLAALPDKSNILRAMTAKIRRDRDIVTEFAADHSKLLTKDDGTLLTIEPAANLQSLERAASDARVDIVAVDGDIDGVDNLALGDNKRLTSGVYEFSRDGAAYSVRLSNSGKLRAAAGKSLLRVGNDDRIDHLSLDAGSATAITHDIDHDLHDLLIDHNDISGAIDLRESNGHAMRNVEISADSITVHGDGHELRALTFDVENKSVLDNISIDHLQTNGSVYIGAGDNSIVSRLSVTNNIQNIHGSESMETNGALMMRATDGAVITVDEFFGNDITTDDPFEYGVYNLAEGVGSEIIYSDKFSDNYLDAVDDAMHNGVQDGAILDMNLVEHNTFISRGDNNHGVYNRVGNNEIGAKAFVKINDFSNNVVEAFGDYGSAVDDYALSGGSITYGTEAGGGFTYNHLIANGEHANAQLEDANGAQSSIVTNHYFGNTFGHSRGGYDLCLITEKSSSEIDIHVDSHGDSISHANNDAVVHIEGGNIHIKN